MAPLTAEAAALIAAAWSPSIPTHFWLDSVTYLVGQIVVHNGGLWIEVNPEGCVDSEPDVGNTDWVPLAGSLSVVVQTTAAEMNVANSSPIVFVPAPGAGKIIVPIRLVGLFIEGSITYPGASERDWQWLLGATPYAKPFGPAHLIDAGDRLADSGDNLGVTEAWARTTPSAGNTEQTYFLLPGVNQPLMLQAPVDFTGQDGIDADTLSINSAGTGYSVLDNPTVDGGNNDAQIEVFTVDGGGAVLTFRLNFSGSGYTPAVGATTTGGGGTGFTVDFGAVGDGNGAMVNRLEYQILDVP